MPTDLPKWFRPVAIVILLWSLMGLAAFTMQSTMSEVQMAELPEAQARAWREMPIWAWLAYAVAVGAGFVGAIGLLMRKRWALPVFVLSLIGVIVQFSYTFVFSSVGDELGPSAAIFPTFIALVGAFEIWLSRKAMSKGWLA